MINELLNLRSGRQSEALATKLGNNHHLVPEMVNFICNSNPQVAWRASWVLNKVADKEPVILLPYHPKLVEILKVTTSNGVRRHLTNILGSYPSTACEDGVLVDLCLKWITDLKIPVAVKANSMLLMQHICKVYPELIPEFKGAIEIGLESASPGYKSRARKVIFNL